MLNNAHKQGFYLALITSCLALIVIVLGAYTRLTDAGLGCPDWPGCYGQWIVQADMDPNMNTTKAWTEMIHRYFAGSLGLLILTLSLYTVYQRKTFSLLPIALVGLVIFQALLGMWTVTLKLLPLVVMAHLLGGLAILAGLWWITLSSYPQIPTSQAFSTLKGWITAALVMLLIQLFLGGWTSANYAALVCPDFPFCHEQFIHSFDFQQAFNLLGAGVAESNGKLLSSNALITIHMMHRLGALLTTVLIGCVAYQGIFQTKFPLLKKLCFVLVFLTLLQLTLGITNVMAILPLSIAVMHNGVSALLLLTLLTLFFVLHQPYKRSV